MGENGTHRNAAKQMRGELIGIDITRLRLQKVLPK
jgi:hypothetical protein